MSSAERQRLSSDHRAWTAWGPYLAERAWGTVREDYSANGDAWRAFTYDDARSRAYRWNEDGMFGFCDRDQRWCLSVAFWNGEDSHLKERYFGLSGHEGNHAEDPKDEWWYLDALPSHAWGSQAFAYPQTAFPYDELRRANAELGRDARELELLDTGVLDGARWEIRVDHAKANPDDLCLRIHVHNAGDADAVIHVVPTIWFRNRWRWGRGSDPIPELRRADHGGFDLIEPGSGQLSLTTTAGGVPLVCDNETNRPLVHGLDAVTDHPKDAINDHIVDGADSLSSDGVGTKGALWHRVEVAAGASVAIDVRLAPDPRPVGEAMSEVMSQRSAEADEFYDELLASVESPDDRLVARQAFAGLLHSKQWYHFDVDQWLDGDPASAPPPAERLSGRNVRWRHLNNADVISMPDTWEYPWYAAWDTAFHCLPLTQLDPAFAKEQLVLLGREWYMHPNGQLPAYEWSFSDVNPPVHAWAGLRVFELDGAWDIEFLERLLHKLMINFTWWVNRRDPDGNNLFDGGFLGLDNIGPFNRSDGLGVGRLEQADATGWMAMYALDLLDMSLRLTEQRQTYEDLATKFAEHFAYISTAMHEDELWDDEEGFYYDVLRIDSGDIPIKVRSMVGLIPIFATRIVSAATRERLPAFNAHVEWFRENKPEFAEHIHENDGGDLLFSLVSPERLVRLLERVLDPDEFLSEHGIRGLSKTHESEPWSFDIDGRTFAVGYEPGESQTSLFGGNSNWRGPVWMPLNYLLIESLRRFDFWASGTIEVEYPVGSGNQASLGDVAARLGERLVNLVRMTEDGRRPSMPDHPHYHEGGPWADRVLFHEYFDGDTGRGLGAPHQTGWTALIATLVTDEARPLGRRRWKR